MGFNFMGFIMRKKTATVHGVGINDAEYPVKRLVNGVRKTCEFYMRWEAMLKRCYSAKYHIKTHNTLNVQFVMNG